MSKHMLLVHAGVLGAALLLVFLFVPAGERGVFLVTALVATLLWALFVYAQGAVLALPLLAARRLGALLFRGRWRLRRLLFRVHRRAADARARARRTEGEDAPSLRFFLDEESRAAGFDGCGPLYEEARRSMSAEEWMRLTDDLDRATDRRLGSDPPPSRR